MLPFPFSQVDEGDKKGKKWIERRRRGKGRESLSSSCSYSRFLGVGKKKKVLAPILLLSTLGEEEEEEREKAFHIFLLLSCVKLIYVQFSYLRIRTGQGDGLQGTIPQRRRRRRRREQDQVLQQGQEEPSVPSVAAGVQIPIPRRLHR